MNVLYLPALSADNQVIVPVSGILLRLIVGALLVSALIAFVVFLFNRFRGEIEKRVEPVRSETSPDTANRKYKHAGSSPTHPDGSGVLPKEYATRKPKDLGTRPPTDQPGQAAENDEAVPDEIPAAAPTERRGMPSPIVVPPTRPLPEADAKQSETPESPAGMETAAPDGIPDEKPPARRGMPSPIVAPPAQMPMETVAKPMETPESPAGMEASAPDGIPDAKPPQRRRGMPAPIVAAPTQKPTKTAESSAYTPELGEENPTPSATEKTDNSTPARRRMPSAKAIDPGAFPMGQLAPVAGSPGDRQQPTVPDPDGTRVFPGNDPTDP